MTDHEIREGDVLAAHWGWGQINVDYWIVLKRTPKMAVLRRIETQIVEVGVDGGANDLVLPNTHERIGPPVQKKVKVDDRGREFIQMARWARAPIARKWDGQRNRQTNFAYCY